MKLNSKKHLNLKSPGNIENSKFLKLLFAFIVFKSIFENFESEKI